MAPTPDADSQSLGGGAISSLQHGSAQPQSLELSPTCKGLGLTIDAGLVRALQSLGAVLVTSPDDALKSDCCPTRPPTSRHAGTVGKGDRVH